jgi:AraC family transcriptional regulator
MQIEPRIETLTEKKLIGKKLTMSWANPTIAELWQSFMPRRREIKNNVTNDLISMVIYQSSHFVDFKITNEFEKWAAVEVSDFNHVPSGLETFTLGGGLYAVFHYKGSSDDGSIFQYIFGAWLPNSNYVLDNRPHLEILGEKYENNDPNSEEEIWIPIKKKD